MQLAGSAQSEEHYVRKEASPKQPSHIQDVPIQTKALTSSTRGILGSRERRDLHSGSRMSLRTFPLKNAILYHNSCQGKHKTFQFILHLQSVNWGKHWNEEVFGRTAKDFIWAPTFAYSFWNNIYIYDTTTSSFVSRLTLEVPVWFARNGPRFDTRQCYSITLPSTRPENTWAQR